MLSAVLKTVKMLLSYCPKNSQDAVVLTALKAVQDAEKNHPTKTKYKDLFPSWCRSNFSFIDWDGILTNNHKACCTCHFPPALSLVSLCASSNSLHKLHMRVSILRTFDSQDERSFAMKIYFISI
jgi:hypothetical protein